MQRWFGAVLALPTKGGHRGLHCGMLLRTAHQRSSQCDPFTSITLARPAGSATLSAVFRSGVVNIPANGLCGRRFLATVR